MIARLPQCLGKLFCVLFLTSLLLIPNGFAVAGEWQAEPATGCKVWNASPQLKDSFTWTGGCKDGLLDGTGLFQWVSPSGAINGTYEGTMVGGKFHGKGRLTYTDGAVYEGDFVSGIRTGKGVFIWAEDGQRYEGDFVNGKRHGYGVMKFPDGRIQQGRFENNSYMGP